MEFRVAHDDLASLAVDAIIVPVFEEGPVARAFDELDRTLDGALRAAVGSGVIAGQAKQQFTLFVAGKIRPARVILVGAGPVADLDEEVLRSVAARGLRAAERAARVAVAFFGPELGALTAQRAAQALTEGLLLGAYRFDRYRSNPEASLQEVVLALGGAADAGAKVGAERGAILAQAANLARDLANEPGNRLPPAVFAQRAQELAQREGLEAEVWDETRLRAEGFGALLAVGQGSAQPPRLVVIRYRGGGAGPTLALVGKGITFDSGGISLKPGAGMEAMRMDKGGAAAVMGAMLGIARLKPKVNVMAVLALAENMPGASAQRPGDVISTLSGKTVEIISTDAEGRLVLADAVHYAAREGVRWIVDVATLTGAVIVALGHEAAAVLGNDEALLSHVQAAGREAGERIWPLPAWREYREQYKSPIADIKNVGGRAAGTITGGLIIGEFVGQTSWAHLDIAGVAWEQERAYQPKDKQMATGWGARTLCILAERLAQER